MKRVRWGILSTANIGTQKVVPALQLSELCEVVAIASRNQATADQAAAKLGIPRAYGNYADLLADPEIDAVYLPLPNHLHSQWSLQTLAAGKHLLCEKPLALSVAEAETLLAVAAEHPHLKVMEAFMYRHHPQWHKAKELVDTGQIGSLQAIQTTFSYFKLDPENIRNRPEMGGGGLMDIGCYAISLARFLFNREPQRVCGALERDPTLGVDRLTTAILDFEPGLASFLCSTQMVPYQRVHIFGTEGRVEIEIPFNAPADQSCRIWHERDGKTFEIVFDICDQFTLQADLFASAILHDTPVPTPLADGVANMRVLAAIQAAAESQIWISDNLAPPA